MYTRIVAGVDGSTQGEHALRHATGLAKALGAEMRIVHVVLEKGDSGHVDELRAGPNVQFALPRA